MSAIPVCKILKTDDAAIVPNKTHESDVGYDLTIIKEFKRLGPNTIMYDTGIIAVAPDGYYLEIVPRSSLSKTGWMLANSVGIVDPSYRGSLLVAVVQVDPLAEPLPIPFRGFQLVIRKQHFVEMVEVTNVEETVRGDGGFGSTGN